MPNTLATELHNQLYTLDYIVFSAVILATLSAIVYGHKRKGRLSENNSFLDFMLMGRKLSLPLFVATLVATWYGGIFGVTRIAFESGIYNFITQGVFWYVTYIIFAVFLIKRVRAYEAVTLPELVGKMFGPSSAKVAGLFNLMNIIPVSYTISLGLLLKALWGIELPVAMLVSLSFVSMYSLFGGFRAVVFFGPNTVFCDVPRCIVCVPFSVNEYGGIHFLQSHLPETHFNITGEHSLATTFAWGLIAVSTLVDPNFYQRCFAALSDQVAKKGIFIATVIWILFDICTTAGAMYARAVMPEADSATAYLNYALSVLPPGLRGFFLAGVVATILSTIDSYLFIGGTTLSYDLLPGKKKSIFKNHIGIFVTAGLSFLLAIAFEGNIKMVWKTLGSYSAACLLFPVLYGYLYSNRVKDKEFVVTCLVGVVVTTYWRLSDKTGFWAQIDELYMGVLATSFCLLVFHLRRSPKLRVDAQ